MSNEHKTGTSSGQSAGISSLTAIGAAIAVQLSWQFTHSVWWALVHGVFGWFYVLYQLWVGKAVL